ARPNGEVSEYERRYEDGSDPHVLDIVSVPLLQPQPHSFQSENWLLDPDRYWQKIGRVGSDKLLTLEQRPRTLWINGLYGSTGMTRTTVATTVCPLNKHRLWRTPSSSSGLTA